MNAIMQWLDGKRTYITIILAAIFNIGVAAGWWTPENDLVNAINMIFASFGIGFLRKGVSKSEKK